jgi:hypothetical protein
MNKIHEGIIMLMGTATLAIIVLPICMNSAAEKFSIDRLNENQVPQNTPDINTSRDNEMNCEIFSAITSSNWLMKQADIANCPFEVQFMFS